MAGALLTRLGGRASQAVLTGLHPGLVYNLMDDYLLPIPSPPAAFWVLRVPFDGEEEPGFSPPVGGKTEVHRMKSPGPHMLSPAPVCTMAQPWQPPGGKGSGRGAGHKAAACCQWPLALSGNQSHLQDGALPPLGCAAKCAVCSGVGESEASQDVLAKQSSLTGEWGGFPVVSWPTALLGGHVGNDPACL